MTQCAYIMTDEQFAILDNQRLMLKALVDLAFEGLATKEDMNINREGLGTIFMLTSHAIEDTLKALPYGKIDSFDEFKSCV